LLFSTFLYSRDLPREIAAETGGHYVLPLTTGEASAYAIVGENARAIDRPVPSAGRAALTWKLRKN
jgi:hypothetical protein